MPYSGVVWCEGFNEVQLGQSAAVYLPDINPRPDLRPLGTKYPRLAKEAGDKIGHAERKKVLALAPSASATALTCGSYRGRDLHR